MAISPSAPLFFPNYQEATCYQKVRAEFDAWDTEKYLTKDACCRDKFSGDMGSCCEEGEGECPLSGNVVYIPDWHRSKCVERDENLLMDWEVEWSSSNAEDCCEKCKYVFCFFILFNGVTLFQRSCIFLKHTDFSNDKRCGANMSGDKFYPDYTSHQCNKKPLEEFAAYEVEVFDTLLSCCREKFPNSISSCCDAEGAGGCLESGLMKWIPDWYNSHCIAKVSSCLF